MPLPAPRLRVHVTRVPVYVPAVCAQLTGELDPRNTTVFVGGLSPMVSEDMLRHHFLRCDSTALNGRMQWD